MVTRLHNLADGCHAPVDGNPALPDQILRPSPRSNATLGQELLQSFGQRLVRIERS